MSYLAEGWRMVRRSLQAVVQSVQFIFTGELPESDLHHFTKRRDDWHKYLFGKKFGDY